MQGEVFVVPKWSAHEVANFNLLIKTNKNGDAVLNMASCALINYMPVVGLNKITETNFQDLWIRIAIFQAIRGSLYHFEKADKKISLFLTKEDIRRHIGLSTEGVEISFQEFCNKWLEGSIKEDSMTPAWLANGCKSMYEFVLLK